MAKANPSLELCRFCGQWVDYPCTALLDAYSGSCIHILETLEAGRAATKPREPDDKFTRLARQKQRMVRLAVKQALRTFDKDKEYDASWRTDGGIGAWFTFKRKWDRMVSAVKGSEFMGEPVLPFDVFKRFEIDRREEGILDDVSDLMGYFMVLIEYMMELGFIKDILSEPSQVELRDPPGVEVTAVVTGHLDNDWLLGHAEAPTTGRSHGGVEQEHPFGYDAEQENT